MAKQKPTVKAPAQPAKAPPAPKSPAQQLHVVAWALVHRKGGVAPLKLDVDLLTDLSLVEVTRAELGQEDYRAMTERKVAHLMSSHTPEWPA